MRPGLFYPGRRARMGASQFCRIYLLQPTFRTLNWHTHSWGANGESLGRDNSQKYPLILGHNRIDLLGLAEN